mmetsp:Transcript_24382/g.84747  ORF Transcript_24382/g.84747 Transcript_24382/m.84747 type:complete len:269 (-) Transcript_24382:58-864(-)
MAAPAAATATPTPTPRRTPRQLTTRQSRLRRRRQQQRRRPSWSACASRSRRRGARLKRRLCAPASFRRAWRLPRPPLRPPMVPMVADSPTAPLAVAARCRPRSVTAPPAAGLPLPSLARGKSSRIVTRGRCPGAAVADDGRDPPPFVGSRTMRARPLFAAFSRPVGTAACARPLPTPPPATPSPSLPSGGSRIITPDAASPPPRDEGSTLRPSRGTLRIGRADIVQRARRPPPSCVLIRRRCPTRHRRLCGAPNAASPPPAARAQQTR